MKIKNHLKGSNLYQTLIDMREKKINKYCKIQNIFIFNIHNSNEKKYYKYHFDNDILSNQSISGFFQGS